MIRISLYIARGWSSLSLGEFMSVIFTLIKPELFQKKDWDIHSDIGTNE